VHEGAKKEHIILERFLDMRYEGQSYEIITPLAADFIEGFHVLHEKTYGYRNDKTVQIVNIRLRARGKPKKPEFEKLPNEGEFPPESSLLGERQVVFDGKKLTASIFNRDMLLCGNKIQGPAVIVEYSATALLPPFAAGSVDEFGNIVLEITPEAV